MRTLLCALALSLLLGTSPALAADEKAAAKLTPKEIADGWIMLFDGVTTFGWNVPEGAEVKSAELMLTAGKASATTAFGECELTFRYRQDSAEGKQAALVLREQRGYALPANAGWTDARIKFQANATTLEFRNKNTASGGEIGLTGAGTAPASIQFDVPAGVKLTLTDVKLKPVGLQSIFNGKDLTGWNVVPGHKSKFTVTDKGELNIKDGNGDIQTEGQWADFVLQLDVFSNGPHLNSGVFVRCIPGQFWAGYEAQIRNEWISDVMLKDGTKLTGSYTARGDDIQLQVYTMQGDRPRATKEVKKLAKADIEQVVHHRDKPIDFGTGAIYNRQPARKVVSDDYQWFTMTIAGQGNHLAVWVNGYQTADFTDKRPANDNARNGSKTSKGAVSLQGHDPTTDLSFRNIRIAELAAGKP